MMAMYINVRKHESQTWYQEWCDESAKLFRARGLKRSDFKDICKDIIPVEGLLETLFMLREAKIKTAIVSGGIDTFLEEKMPGSESLFDYLFINKFNFDSNGAFLSVDTTKYDFEGKWYAVEEMCRTEGISPEQVVFVGDGFNDEHILGRVGLTIGFNANSTLMSENSDVKIWDGDLRKILPHILP
jgi:phosphoserine phosphatase